MVTTYHFSLLIFFVPCLSIHITYHFHHHSVLSLLPYLVLSFLSFMCLFTHLSHSTSICHIHTLFFHYYSHSHIHNLTLIHSHPYTYTPSPIHSFPPSFIQSFIHSFIQTNKQTNNHPSTHPPSLLPPLPCAVHPPTPSPPSLPPVPPADPPRPAGDTPHTPQQVGGWWTVVIYSLLWWYTHWCGGLTDVVDSLMWYSHWYDTYTHAQSERCIVINTSVVSFHSLSLSFSRYLFICIIWMIYHLLFYFILCISDGIADFFQFFITFFKAFIIFINI